ncbi:hypothetical protein [Paraflavitalea sp. CAU 1676]|uniref:hypothetical protein n=1 Tax=Paraflavitalea sp. CAU 1676 TaxID=3032598 RepID=UPI0023DB0BE5|nr:hypothetical protein [Paraflavitalea sp. CAU 1676]MDF2188943.1 hypothetical protein [Paraflavitalea sp. CAU 1676]
MNNVKNDGAKPITLQAVERQPEITPVKKLKPKPVKEKVVYKSSMERMTNRDWTGLKKRLRYMRGQLDCMYTFDSHIYLLNPDLAPPKALQRKKRKEIRQLVNAIDLLLEFEGLVNLRYFTREDFKPGERAPFTILANKPYTVTPYAAKHPLTTNRNPVPFCYGPRKKF